MPLKNTGESSRKRHSVQEKRRGCEEGTCLVMKRRKLSSSPERVACGVRTADDRPETLKVVRRSKFQLDKNIRPFKH